jgi:hypothetical protein
MKIIIITACLTLLASAAHAAGDDDDAIRQAQACSTAKAIEYAQATADPASTIAEAAFDACDSLWQKAYPSYTHEQFMPNPYLASTAARLAEGERNAEIKRLVVLVFDTRVSGQKEKSK